MIPKRMLAYLRERLPESTWETRLVRRAAQPFWSLMSRLLTVWPAPIEVDHLGPRGSVYVG